MVWEYSLLGSDFFYILSLSPVQIRCTRPSNFFLTKSNIEEHWLLRLWPREIQSKTPLVAANSILKRSLIEKVGWKFREFWVHSILNFQSKQIFQIYMQKMYTEVYENIKASNEWIMYDSLPKWPHVENYQPFKKRLAQACISCFFTHDYRAKLTMVSDKYNLFSSQYNWHHALWLCSLKKDNTLNKMSLLAFP